ncbi:glycerophosphodiester phosphodiesterase family protein [Photobacterium nomapromontoriensis]|uniref:glycerophosphodiester phosphodiesterase family protein n=1 Tax=Photobacterium nomapromontoriensis TaxID=2910237 RepID=UPI003D0E2869
MVTGHRGAAALAPENTLAGIKQAAQSGATWIEIDTQLSADCIPVIIHDETVNRCTNGKGKVANLTLAQLKSFDAGSWFNTVFNAETIPTLEEALNACQVLGLKLNLELKIHHPHQIEPLIHAVVDVIKQSQFPIEHLVLSSFEKEALTLCQDLLPNVRRGFICEVWNDFSLESIQPLALYSVHIDHRILTAKIANAIKNAGMVLVIWTLNDPQKTAHFKQLGVDNIITNKPHLFVAD